MIQPCEFIWDGEAMHTAPRFRALASSQYKSGEQYRLEVIERRSSASHAHYFAVINNAWQNLPETWVPEDRVDPPQNAEQLRKWALIKTGWCDEQTIECDTPSDARLMAAFTRKLDRDYSEIKVRGSTVIFRRAKSQSRHAMNAEDFKKSKADVLDLLAFIVGVTRMQLDKQGKEAVT